MGDASLGRYVVNPRMRVQKAEVRLPLYFDSETTS
jgi:hypothetical protein